MAAERAPTLKRGPAPERSASGQSDDQRGSGDYTGDGWPVGANSLTRDGEDHPSRGRADDSLPSSVARFDALVGVLEKRGLLARAVAIHSGDLDVKLAPTVPVLVKPERDVLQEGEDKKKLDDDILYGSS
jgi:hypothetical protein